MIQEVVVVPRNTREGHIEKMEEQGQSRCKHRLGMGMGMGMGMRLRMRE